MIWRWLVAQAIVAFEFVRHGLAQFRNARRRSVFLVKPFGQRLVAGVLDVLRRVKIRFANAETNDILTIGLHLFGLRINGQGQRRGQGRGAMRNLIFHKLKKQITVSVD